MPGENMAMEDLLSTVVLSGKRLTGELRRASDYDTSYVAVEADLRDILGGRYRPGAHPNPVVEALISSVVDFGRAGVLLHRC